MQNTWAVQAALGQIVFRGTYESCMDYMYAFVAEYTIKKIL